MLVQIDHMLAFIFIVIGVLYFLMKQIINHKSSRFYSINIMLIIIYNVIGWWYIFEFLGTGGASLGPGMMLIFLTGVHLVLLILIAVIKGIINSGKEQNRLN